MRPAISHSLSERGKPDDPVWEVRLRRRLPWAALAATISGGAVILGAAVLYALHQFPDWDAVDSLAIDKRLIVLAFILPVLSIVYFPAVWAWLTGPRLIAFGRTGFSLGVRRLAYEQVASLRNDYSKELTDIALRDGERIRLRWSIWHRHDLWGAMLASATRERLLAEASQKLKRGEELDFGKRLRMSLQTVTLKGRRVPIREITFVHSLSGTAGDDYRNLRVGTLGPTMEMDLSKVANSHVFFELMQMLITAPANSDW